MTLRLAAIAIAALGILGAAAPARADEARAPEQVKQPVPRVVIVVEVAVNVPDGRADAIAAALADALNRELEVDALGGDDVTRRLPAEGLPDECVGNPECIQTIASRLGAEQLLFLAIVQVGDETQVDATWVDVATGASASRPRATIQSEARAVSVFGEMARRYLPDARIRDKTIVINNGNGNNGGMVFVPGRSTRHFTQTTYITGGGAAATRVGAAALGLWTRSTFKDCERRGCDDDQLDSIDRRALFADLTLGVSLAATATTVVLYMLSGNDEEPMMKPEVAPTPGGATIGIGGRF